MKPFKWIVIGIVLLITILFIYSLATYIDDKEGFVTGTTGIAEICLPDVSTNATSNSPVTYGVSPSGACYDISYIDSTTGQSIQVSAKIANGFYIDVSGYLEPVPYGYKASSNMLSFVPVSKTAAYEQSIITNEKTMIDMSINEIQAKVNKFTTKKSRNNEFK